MSAYDIDISVLLFAAFAVMAKPRLLSALWPRWYQRAYPLATVRILAIIAGFGCVVSLALRHFR